MFYSHLDLLFFADFPCYTCISLVYYLQCITQGEISSLKREVAGLKEGGGTGAGASETGSTAQGEKREQNLISFTFMSIITMLCTYQVCLKLYIEMYIIRIHGGHRW